MVSCDTDTGYFRASISALFESAMVMRGKTCYSGARGIRLMDCRIGTFALADGVLALTVATKRPCYLQAPQTP